jgi:hypothetical protein
VPTEKIAIFLIATCLAVSGLLATRPAQAAENVLYRFNGKDGANPTTGLIFDDAGNLYGTTMLGGAFNAGTAFELMPGENGTWTYKLLHSFNGTDGRAPNAGLVLDQAGNLYGTTTEAGSAGHEWGNIFELTPGANGKWTEKVLYNFDKTDGALPYGNLVFDASGNLYGTASAGCGHGLGCVFELSANANGKWTQKILIEFNGADGGSPVAGVIFDSAGNLYGTTFGGGAPYNGCGGTHGCGTVFELTPSTNETWTETMLFDFQPKGTGRNPQGGVILDTEGNVYGTTYGVSSAANVFELMRGNGGSWTEKVLYEVDGNPTAGLLFDATQEHLYGTNNNVAFKLRRTTNGYWTETILHTFKYNSTSGTYPESPLISDQAGNLYGTTLDGGSIHACSGTPYGCGVVYELMP